MDLHFLCKEMQCEFEESKALATYWDGKQQTSG